MPDYFKQIQVAPIQTPNWGQLAQHSIDSLFENYFRSKQLEIQQQTAQSQLAGQQQAQKQSAADWAGTHYGFSPEEFPGATVQAYADATSQPSMYATPQAANPQQGPGASGIAPQAQPQPGPWAPGMAQQQPQQTGQAWSPQGQPSPQDPRMVAYKQHIAAQLHAVGLGAQKLESETAKTGAEAQLAQAQAGLITGNGGQGAGSPIDQHIQNIMAGKEDPSADFGRGPEGQALRVAIGNKLAAMGANKTDLQAKFDAAQKRASAQAGVQGEQGQRLGAAAGTLEDILSQASPLVKNFSPSDWQDVNKLYTNFKAKVNNPQAKAFVTLMNEAKGKYATVLAAGNSAGQTEKDDAHESIGNGLTPDSYAAMQNAVNFAAKSTVKRVTGRGYDEPSPTPTPSSSDTSSLSSVPRAGRHEVNLFDAKGNPRAAIYNGPKFVGWK